MTKLALYDWLRCGGSNVNIDSIIALEALPMDLPVKTWTPWKALDPSNLPNLQILGDVPTGIMHIYTFNKDGTTKYVSKTIQPYPYTTVGENQLYGELRTDKGLPTKVKTSLPWKLSGVKFLDVVKNVIKTGEVEGEGKVDLYVRDLSRVLGNKQGGKHGGERLDGNPLVSYQREPILLRNIPIAMTSEFFPEYAADLAGEFPISSGEVVGTTGGGGQGAPALVSRQDDFASTTPFPPIPPPPFTVYSQGPAGGAPRPCYTKNGVAADIRFRRQVKVGDLAILLGGYKIGYIGEMLP